MTAARRPAAVGVARTSVRPSRLHRRPHARRELVRWHDLLAAFLLWDEQKTRSVGFAESLTDEIVHLPHRDCFVFLNLSVHEFRILEIGGEHGQTISAI